MYIYIVILPNIFKSVWYYQFVMRLACLYQVRNRSSAVIVVRLSLISRTYGRTSRLTRTSSPFPVPDAARPLHSRATSTSTRSRLPAPGGPPPVWRERRAVVTPPMQKIIKETLMNAWVYTLDITELRTLHGHNKTDLCSCFVSHRIRDKKLALITVDWVDHGYLCVFATVSNKVRYQNCSCLDVITWILKCVFWCLE